MGRLRPWRGYWTALAGALAASCIINPQPEPPGNNLDRPATGGQDNAGLGTGGGAPAAGGNGYHIAGGVAGTGGAASVGTGTNLDPGHVLDAGDADADDDAGDDSP